MASSKVLVAKKENVSEILNHIQSSESVILFQYQGLTVSELSELRNKLRETDAIVKVYKNTLLKRALDEQNFLEGPNAILFGKNLLEPIKVISDFAKDHAKLEIRIGIISGSVADIATIQDYASIPSYEGLLTMLCRGMMEHVNKLAIVLNQYAENLEK